MKKIFLFCFMFIFLIGSVGATDIGLAKNSESAILIEASTGKILFEKEKDKKMAPASMTKIMTMLLAMEAIENGKLNLEDEVLISKRAQSMGGTQIYVEAGSNVKVHDLLKGIGIASANDAAVAIAEKIGGTVENFVNMMNERARDLGCKNTTFKNPHGLDEDGHLTTAYDMALMARELVKHELAIKISSTFDEYINVSGENHWLVNTNKLIKFYKGIDGLKTGYTDKAGYCLTATMNKNNMRLISVVMKSNTKDNRSSDTIGMMEYGYSMYGSETILNKKDYSGVINIKGSENRNYKYYLENDIKIIVDKDRKNIKYITEVKLNDVKAPIEKGSKVGELILKYDNNTYTYDLVIHDEVKKATFLKIFFSNLKDIVTGHVKQ
jgi:D-alanyl-D-alanine carboxypeptidase (penicillin-binding protein 5/6)